MQSVTFPGGVIHQFSSPANGFLVNSYIIEFKDELILIDTQFILSEMKRLQHEIEKLNKPLSAIFITHPHPDHFNGTFIFTGAVPSVKVYATQATVDGIKNIEAAKREYWKPIYKEDYPDVTSLPNSILASGESVSIAGSNFLIEDIGAGETSNMSLIYFSDQKILFAGDLVYNHVHPWLVEGHTKNWLEQLEVNKLKYTNARYVLVGHGDIGGPEMFQHQADYILFFRSLVENNIGTNGHIDEGGKEKIIAGILSKYGSMPLEMLLEPNINGVLAELQSPQ